MLNCSSPLNSVNLLSNHSGHHFWARAGSLMAHSWPDFPCHNYVELHSMKTSFLWIIYWDDCISLGPPLERWHTGAVVGLSRLCAQAAILQGQTVFCIFMAGFTAGKWSFPGLWRQWRGWSGTTEDPSAQHEIFKTAKASFHPPIASSSDSHTSTALTPYIDPDVQIHITVNL